MIKIKKFKTKNIFIFLLLVLVLTNCNVKKDLPDNKNDKVSGNEVMNEQLEKLEAEVERLKIELEDLHFEIEDMENNFLDQLQEYIDNYVRSYSSGAYYPDEPMPIENEQEIGSGSENSNTDENIGNEQPVEENSVVQDSLGTDQSGNNTTYQEKSSMSFYCPESMKVNNTYTLHAMIKPLFEGDLRNELLSVVNEARQEVGESALDITDIRRKDVILGRYIKVELIDPTKEKFTIVPFTEPQKTSDSLVDIYDNSRANYYGKDFLWRWSVTPKEGSEGKAKLKFRVLPFDKDKNKIEAKATEFLIVVDFENSFIENIWVKANTDPEWAVASIITPLLTFFAGFFIKRKKEDKALENKKA